MSKYDQQSGKTTTSTQIRNMYSEGVSYMNIKFFNTNLSFNLAPFMNKDQTGKSIYDFKNAQMTTVNFEGAFALYQTAKDIIENKINECNLVIPCSGGATLTLKRSMGTNGQMETVFSISKNNVIIPFLFATIDQVITENGQPVTRRIEVGLGSFMKTIEGYLTGINADRHLNKLTDDFVASQQGGQPRQQGGGWNGGGQRRQYNNGGGQNSYHKSYQPQGQGGGYQQNGGWRQQGGQQQNMSDYSLPN